MIKEVRGPERSSANRLSGGEDGDEEMKFRSCLPVFVHEVCGKVSSNLMVLHHFPRLCRARGLMPG